MSRTIAISVLCIASLPALAFANAATDEKKVPASVSTISGEDVAQAPVDFSSIYWNGDRRFASANEDFAARIGGRIHYDAIYTDDEDEATDGLRFRRARLYLRGTAHRNVDYNFAVDFAGGDADFRDMYITVNEFAGPLYVQLGQFFAPHGLETQTSSNTMAFVERSPLDGLSIARASGIATGSSFADGNGTWKFAVVNRNTDSDGDAASGHWEAALRGTYRFDLGESDNSFMHLGAGITHGSSRSGLSFDGGAGVARGADLVALAGISADDIQRINLEWAGVFGPFSVQAEYRTVDLGGEGGADDTTLDGAYVQASWFATDDVRPYKNGLFAGVEPRSPWSGWGNGTGALEFVARYSFVDFSDSPAAAGATDVEGDLITLGANWYLNRSTRFMLNYNLAESEDDDGTTTDRDSIVLRTQFTF